MKMLGEVPNTLFIGQSVRYPGNVQFTTLKDVPIEKRIELPVFEDTQMGMSIGLSLSGYLPISIYPRMDFLLSAINQLVNHLDKIELMSEGRYKPKVIIRTAIGTRVPMNSGPQHTGDYLSSLMSLTKNITIYYLNDVDFVYRFYTSALKENKSSILVERGDLYDVQPSK